MSTHGLFIPPAVLGQKDLSLSALLVLSEILNLHKVNRQVWAPDQYFSARIPAIKPRTVQSAMIELEQEGFITRVTNQRAVHKRIITPTALCFQAIAESAIGQPEETRQPEPLADSAIATPNLSQNPLEPPAESATDLSQNPPEPIADSANRNNQESKRVNKTPSSRKGAGRGSTKSLSPEVKNPAKGQLTSEPTTDPGLMWIAENAPRVQRLQSPMTAKQWASLVADYGEVTVKSVLEGMENRATLLKDYTSANLTAREWCRRRGPKLPKPSPKPAAAPDPELNKEEVARADEQRKAAAAENLRRIREASTTTQD